MDHSALVTGATGFIGGRLASTLVSQGWSVRAVGRRARPADLPAAAEYEAVDLAGGADLGGLYDGVTHLFHLAGASSSNADEAEMERSNVAATANLLRAAPAGQLARVVHMSSTSIYGEEVQLPSPVPEDVEPSPSRAYGKAKWRTEQVLQEAGRSGLPVVALRPVSVYGPGNVKLLASAILDVAIEVYGGATSVPVPAEPIEQRLVHIDDLLRAAVHVAAAEDAVGRAFNVVDERYPTSHEIAHILGDHLGVGIELAGAEAGPSHEERRQAHEAMVAQGMQPDIFLTKERFRFMRKANRNNRLSVEALLATGFRFEHTDLEASIGDTIAWYRAQRWIL
ncbi:MAG: NAD(P)-dependent oxidoreductase [Acidimicrobiales bacterium]